MDKQKYSSPCYPTDLSTSGLIVTEIHQFILRSGHMPPLKYIHSPGISFKVNNSHVSVVGLNSHQRVPCYSAVGNLASASCLRLPSAQVNKAATSWVCCSSTPALAAPFFPLAATLLPDTDGKLLLQDLCTGAPCTYLVLTP